MTVRGTIEVPGDKSISHRALILGAMSSGVSSISGLLDSADIASTAHALRALGVDIRRDGNTTKVNGRGLRGLCAAEAPIDCGNSGTSTRLLAGVAAAHAFATTFTGDASLSARPMNRVAQPLAEMGARFEFESGDGLPMTVYGAQLRSIGWTSSSASAQIKSAVLLAAVTAQVPVAYTEPSLSRDHTERMLAARGVEVARDGLTISLGVARELTGIDVNVPGDPSSAAFFVGLAACTSGSVIRIENVCLNPTRTGFLNVVQRMGCSVTLEAAGEPGGEIVGSIVACGQPHLGGVTIGAAEIPSLIDEIPMLAVIAARADGETVITGASELRVKESDRIGAVVAGLRAVGADAEERADGMTVRGGQHALRGHVETRGDHRLAMAFGVLAALPGNEITLSDRECVSVSYPSFWIDLARVVS